MAVRILMYFSVLLVELNSQRIQELRIGGLLQDDNEEITFRIAANTLNQRYKHLPFRLVPKTSRITPYDAYDVFLQACSQLERGIIGIFGPNSLLSSSHVQAIFDTKEIPHIETHPDPKLIRNNCQLNLYPHQSVLSKAYLDLVTNWNWQQLIIIYENNESLHRIEPLLSLYAKYGTLLILKHLTADSFGNYRPTLTSIKQTGQTNFVLDCSIETLEEVFKQAQQVGMMTEQYSYIVTNLDLQTIDLTPYQFSGINITGLRIIDPDDSQVVKVAEAIQNIRLAQGKDIENEGRKYALKIQVKTALIYDAVQLFYKTIVDLTSYMQLAITPIPVYCNTTRGNWKNGHTIINYMKGQSLNGLTGTVKFDVEGLRRDFSLQVLELTPNGLSVIGTWTPTEGLEISKTYYEPEQKVIEEGIFVNKTFVVAICLTTPYAMLKMTTTQLLGNDRYEGFGIDLIEDLSNMLGFNYTFVVQEDGKNGDYDIITKEWDGLIGEILRGHADLAIADLTVTAERESVVDFSLQFMNLGISILYRKPEPVPPSLFMFISPFSVAVWLMLGVSYVLVSLAFFVMGRLSPSEWCNPYPCVEEPTHLINQFSIRNSLWFTIGSLLQQGSEIAPVGISTRTAAGVWWFFTLIMTSSYTANLAAFLTVETLVTSFGSLEELAQQTEIKYGAKRGGATANFFKDAPNGTARNDIWKFMSAHDEYMTDGNDEGVERVEQENYAFFMESTTIEYVVERHCTLSSVGPPLDDKGYAIAMAKNSPYRNELSTAILKLQETGRITALKEKWWKEKHGAGKCGKDDKDNEATPLNLQNVGGVFLVLFIGTFIGLFWSCIELYVTVYKKSKEQNLSFKKELKNEVQFLVKFKENIKELGDTSNESVMDDKLY